MSRPSLLEVRREQILDAVDRCILAHGVEGLTYQRVAREASVQPSLIPHYFGSKDALFTAAADRILGRVESLASVWVLGGGSDDPTERVGRMLDLVLGPRVQVPEIAELAECLLAASRTRPELRPSVLRIYRRMLRTATDVLADAYPDADRRRCRHVAFSLLCLVRGNNSYGILRLAPGESRHLRGLADALVATLDTPEARPGRRR